MYDEGADSLYHEGGFTESWDTYERISPSQR